MPLLYDILNAEAVDTVKLRAALLAFTPPPPQVTLDFGRHKS
jgi:hypothetical protein